MAAYCLQHRSSTVEPEQWYEDLRVLLVGFAIMSLERMRASRQEPHPLMVHYAAWLEASIDKYCASRSGPPADIRAHCLERVEMLSDDDEFDSHRYAVNVRISRHLPEILTGERDPLQLLFADPNCMSEFYEEVKANSKAFGMLKAYLDSWAHKDPSLKFLEIGAGTGATTSMILDTIANPQQGPRYSEYMYTDISASFFAATQERFGVFDRIHYRILDIERDVEEQGFTPGGFDIIAAANVLHATKDLGKTLANVRRLEYS